MKEKNYEWMVQWINKWIWARMNKWTKKGLNKLMKMHKMNKRWINKLILNIYYVYTYKINYGKIK